MTTAEAPALSYSSVPGRWVLAITVLGSGIAALDATVACARRRIQDRGAHLGRVVRRGRAARRGHDRQPSQGPPASRSARARGMPELRTRCATTDNQR